MKNKHVTFGSGDKRTRIFSLLFLLPFLFLLTSCKQEITLNNQLELRAEIGYDKTVSLSEGNPVKFSISNAGEDFKGEIRISVPLDYDSDAAYVIPFEIAANSQKVIEEFLPLYIVNKEFKYEIRSEGVTIREGLLNATNVLDPAMLRVAVISEDPDNYNFLKNSGLIASQMNSDDIIKYGSAAQALAAPEPAPDPKDQPGRLSYRNFTVHQRNMAKFSNKAALDFFDVVFIGDLSESALSEEGLRNLLDWVENGGVLIVESGENFEKMQRLLPEELRLIDFDDVVEEEVKMQAFQGTLKLAKGTKKREGVLELGINGSKLLYFKNSGAGRIMILNTLLGEGALQEQGAQAQYLSALMEASPALSAYQREDHLGPGNHKLGTIPVSGEMPFRSIGILLAIYSLGIVPITYKILKHKKKQTLMWILGPASSLLLILLISQIGNLTWGNKPISNEVSVIEYHQSQDYLKIKSEIGLFNNRKGEMKISWDMDENIEIFAPGFHNYYDSDEENLRNRKPSLSSARYLQNPPLFYSYETGLWDFVSARAEKIVKIRDEGTRILLNSGEQGEKIRIKNGLPMDLKHAILYRHNKYYPIGDLASGEERDFEMSLLKGETDFYRLKYDAGMGVIDGYEIEDYLQSNYLRSYDKPLIFALSEEPVGYNIRINDELSKSFARNLIVLHLDLEIEEGSKLLLNEAEERRTSAVYTDRKNIAIESRQRALDSYETNGYTLVQIPNNTDRKNENMNSLVTEFKLPSAIEIESIRIDFNSNSWETVNSVIDISSSQRIPIEDLNDRYFIFNYAEGKYDELFLEDFTREDYIMQIDSPQLQKDLEPTDDGMMNIYANHFDRESFLKAKFYEVKNPDYIGGTGWIRIKVLKPELFEHDWFELRQNEIEIKGVYHD